MSAISVRGLTFAYPGRTAVLKELSLEVARGRITVLLGPNGSGKSTLLGLLLGYLFPQTGLIEILGRPLGEYPRKELGRTTGFVSQSSALPFNYPVLEYILLGRAARLSFWGQPGREDLEIAVSAAGEAEIGELIERNVQELSAGELQLVSIARALAQEPRILLLDEPTSHLDPAHAAGVFRLIRRLSARGLTVLFTTHDPLHARQVADEAVLLREGRVLYSGGAAEGLSSRNLERLYGIEFQEAVCGSVRIPFVGLPRTDRG
jgi:iron complex transport system ATP-binding protein